MNIPSECIELRGCISRQGIIFGYTDACFLSLRVMSSREPAPPGKYLIGFDNEKCDAGHFLDNITAQEPTWPCLGCCAVNVLFTDDTDNYTSFHVSSLKK